MPERSVRMATGNEFVSVPDIRQSDGGILNISFLHKSYRAAIELHGSEDMPFLQPVIEIDGQAVPMARARWSHESYWIPTFRLEHQGVRITGSIFAPRGHRGFIYLMQIGMDSSSATLTREGNPEASYVSEESGVGSSTVEGEKRAESLLTGEGCIAIRAGWQGSWGRTYHVCNLSKRMGGIRYGGFNPTGWGTLYMEYRGATPLFAVALSPLEGMESELYAGHSPGERIRKHGDSEASATTGQTLRYSLFQDFELRPGGTKTLALYVGIGLEETSAVTSALDMQRHGWNVLLDDVQRWLSRRTARLDDALFERLVNVNAFYNYFFSQGITLDTEDLVLVTSRSSRYTASAAYLDRDAMLWSLPAVLQIDPPQARKMLEYAFTVQLRNVGVHSRFIDGVTLRPGFELDALCAPIHALWLYVRATGDMSILFDRRIQAGVNRIQQILAARRHPDVPLFETTLLPSGRPARYPYVTYSNVMVWRILKDLSWMYDRIRDLDRAQEAADLADEVRKAVLQHCVAEGPFGQMFAWAVDLRGDYELYDEPVGSLQLLAYLEFVGPDAAIYRNTVRWIHSNENRFSFAQSAFSAPGSEEQPHPHICALANDLLTGRQAEALDILRRTEMDDGIACETIHEETGEVLSGLAFATCAGYLAFSLNYALRGGATALSTRPEPAPVERLYEPPPPEIQAGMEPTVP